MSQPTGCHKVETIGLISMGSNVTLDGCRPIDRLRSALKDVASHGIVIRKASQFYHAPFFPANQGADFVNVAAVIEADLAAGEVLERLHHIETMHNRIRGKRWADRTLDIDLLAWGDAVAPDEKGYSHWRNLPLERQMTDTPTELILPHPRLQDRAFVLVPLNEIIPAWCHPVTGESVQEMLDALPKSDKIEIKPLGN
ncbi:2-amino-4-hydroxy-6-hydroxymethyldihydropteridine diphosphokinase [Falsihalocynthiibacter sp. SS001]|uniref:2-amino-4-hydroxy-6- hydroxymethyldihydropteridine diphosphokinase n=1 Tax=Falsihalocynthiibacter sp. SS001 TaxID=3349698 RepID=UPI0036D3787C